MRLLIIHSSAELYGSDRSLLDFVRHAGQPFEITVVLPESGPLVAALEVAGATVVVGEVCKLRREMLSPSGLWRATVSAWQAFWVIRRLAKDAPFDLIYSNSVVVLGGALYAFFARRPHVWHIREISSGSSKLSFAFRHLVGTFASSVICNSEQTRDWIRMSRASDRYQVIWNGVAAKTPDGSGHALRCRLAYGPADVVFVVAGRINAWKGQGLLVQAFDALAVELGSRVKLLIVGSAFHGQEHFEVTLREQVRKCAHAAQITVMPFRDDIDTVWQTADVAVIPSLDPEPFGRVAIEAMAFAKPVIAAAHGGLLDIVEQGKTGYLFTPRSVDDLLAAMRRLATSTETRERMGAAAVLRQRAIFSVEAYALAVQQQLLLAVKASNRTKERSK